MDANLRSKFMKGDLHFLLEISMFVLYLKIINTILKNNICILKQIIQKTQKWYRNFSRQAVSSYGSRQSKYCFDQ